MPQYPYAFNETMKMLGSHCASEIVSEQAFEEIEDILKARKCLINSYGTIIDIFKLGYIYGKRAERAKKKQAKKKGVCHGTKRN